MRCCVCGWADADDYHELAHLRSEHDYLTGQVAELKMRLAHEPKGGKTVIHSILQVTRGIVRPAVTLASVGAVIAAVFVGKLEAPTLLVMATACLTWWFKERSDRSKGTPTES